MKGFLLPSHDFLIISKLGINVIAIGKKSERVITDQDGFKRMIHSMGSCNYLKIEPEQHILFACQYYDDRQICIQDQYDNHLQQTQFEDIYRIKIHEITLRELMLIQSLYSCKTASDVSQLVKMQPSPMIFFKVYLELGIKSMIPYLSFDARSLLHLLQKNDENDAFFKANNFEKFPVFYKNLDGKSAIDVASENNQIRSVNEIINYIITYQNSYKYAHLFENNLIELIEKEVDVTPLLKSNVLNYTFDFDEWPGVSTDVTKLQAPYNGSIFKLRYEYKNVFKQHYNEEQKGKIKKG